MRFRPFALERFFARYEFNVRWVLCASDCRTRTIAEIDALEPGLLDRLSKLPLGYIDSRGTSSLRDVLAGIYQRVDREQLLVCSGAQEAILWFYFATLTPGDEVVVHTPCYASHREVPRTLGATVVPWRGDPARHFALDVDELERLLTPRTRAIVVNVPHNPTGFLFERVAFERMARLAHERGIVLFSDEVFRESEHIDVLRLPAACDLTPTAVSLGVTSKSYGLAGLRVGWVATRNREVYEKMAALKDYSTICNGAPNELIAEVAMRHRGDLARENVALIRQNLDLLDAFFSRWPDHFEWRRPSAGPVAFVKLRQGDVDRFCHELVEATGVLLLPGTLFDDTDNRFRLGFGRADLPEALPALESFLRR
jgi:aspartate/methionine/tyrosine aminotransferase